MCRVANLEGEAFSTEASLVVLPRPAALPEEARLEAEPDLRSFRPSLPAVHQDG
jgi:hypothetical protein